MTLEWIRFGITALLLCSGIFFFAAAALGVWKFGFIMNRIHASGVGDTLGLMLVILACIVSAGVTMTSLKLLLIVMFMWCSSPVSGHFMGKIEYRTNPDIERCLRYPEKEKETGSSSEGGDRE